MSYDDLELRVGKVEDGVSDLKADVSAIKVQVTNHLPHSVAAILEAIQTLDSRIAPIETAKTKVEGVNQFMTTALKGAMAVAAVAWSIIQIVNFCSQHHYLWF